MYMYIKFFASDYHIIVAIAKVRTHISSCFETNGVLMKDILLFSFLLVRHCCPAKIERVRKGFSTQPCRTGRLNGVVFGMSP